MQDYADEAAAASAVGTNLMANHREESREFARMLERVALTGSAAAGDSEVELYIGDAYAGRVTVSLTGLVITDISHWKSIGRVVAPNQKIMARISDAGATNILRFHFVTKPIRL